MSEAPRDCLNCGGQPSGRFCQDCGQRASVQRLHPNGLARDFLGNAFNFETGAWRTFLGLAIRPGTVAREYVGGQRLRYVNPLKYFLFALAIYFVAMSTLDLRISELTHARVSVDDGHEQLEEASGALIAFIDEHQRLFLMAGVPAYAWVLGLLFRRRGYNFAEICVLLLYTFAQTTLLIRTPLAILSATTGVKALPLAVLLQLLYVGWAARRFFDTSWWRALLAVNVSLVVWFTALVLVIGSCVAIAVNLS